MKLSYTTQKDILHFKQKASGTVSFLVWSSITKISKGHLLPNQLGPILYKDPANRGGGGGKGTTVHFSSHKVQSEIWPRKNKPGHNNNENKRLRHNFQFNSSETAKTKKIERTKTLYGNEQTQHKLRAAEKCSITQ